MINQKMQTKWWKSLCYFTIASLAIVPFSYAEMKKSPTKTERRNVTVIAIDAGHGGKDPGAIGRNLGIYEKNITLSIATELKALLDADPNFKAVMTRSSDRFVELPERSEIARRNKANYLISIHADSSPTNNLRGASVWVLSNRRASDEMGKWLEDGEKQSMLLGGAGALLANHKERYLNQTVLDLQFSHSQRVGYELGKTVLSRLTSVMTLAKSQPQHASLSVLRSPDIPSILVETGFLSNAEEESKLNNASYRRQVARAIYNGLLSYRSKNIGSISTSYVHKTESAEKSAVETVQQKATATLAKDSSKQTANNKEKAKSEGRSNEKAKEKNELKTTQSTSPTVDLNAKVHIVKENETLYSIARMYKTTPEKLSQLNNIKNNNIWVGKKLKLK